MPAENPVLRWLPRWRKLAVRTRAARPPLRLRQRSSSAGHRSAGGNAVHSTTMSQELARAKRTADSVSFGIPNTPPQQYVDTSWVVTDQNGTWLRSTYLFQEYTGATGDGVPGRLLQSAAAPRLRRGRVPADRNGPVPLPRRELDQALDRRGGPSPS